MRTVFLLTGIRSEYDLLKPVYDAINATDGFRANFIVTGAHLQKRFGYTVAEIEKDGVDIAARIDSLPAGDALSGRVIGIGRQLEALARVLETEQPDYLAVLGDREESIAGALAAAYMRVPVIHIGGGDHADDRNIDNDVRHAVTKLAHLHCVTTDSSRARVLALGEEPGRVGVVGGTGIDRLLAEPELSRIRVLQELGRADWADRPYAVMIQHPTVHDVNEAGELVQQTLLAVENAGLACVIVHPNSDPGNEGIVAAITDFCADRPAFHHAANLPRDIFINLMRHASVMVGNSSAGIIEAPSLQLPVVNVGIRQRGREHADNVIFVEHDAGEIEQALRTSVEDAEYRKRVAKCVSPYGDGTAARKIAGMIAAVDDPQALIGKRHLFGR